MGILDSLSKLLKRESAELKDVLDKAEQRANASLDRKERDLALTPEERLAKIQGEIDESDPLAEMRDKIEHKAAKAKATEDLAEAELDEDGDPLVIDGEVVSDSADQSAGAATDDPATDDEATDSQESGETIDPDPEAPTS